MSTKGKPYITIQNHLDLLGRRITDRVSRLEGVVTSISFDLCGRIQVLVEPYLDADARLRESIWIDINRLEVQAGDPVMARPDFAPKE